MRTFVYCFILTAGITVVPINPDSRPSVLEANHARLGTFQSEHSPSDFYSIGAHGDRLSSPSGDPGDTRSRRLVNSPSGPPSSTSTSTLAYKYTGPSRLYPKQKEIRAGPDSGFPVSRNPFTSGLRGSFPSRVQNLGDSCTRTPSILPPSTNLFSSVPAYVVTHWASGLIPLNRLYLRPLQCHFHSLGLTNQFAPPRRSDPLVLANLLRHWQDLRFLTSGIPIRTFQADFTIFTDASMQGWGVHMGDSQILGTWTRTDRKLHINCQELKAVVSGLQHWAPVLQGNQVMIATDNSTVVSYINMQGGTHPPTLLRLTVHTEIVKHIFRLWGTPEVDMFVSDGNSYHLHAWRLSCDTIKQQAFQTRSLGSPQPLRGPQPIACTTIGGFASLVGPQGKGLIRLIPQLLR